MIKYSCHTFAKMPKSEVVVLPVSLLKDFSKHFSALESLKKKNHPEKGSYKVFNALNCDQTFVIYNFDFSQFRALESLKACMRDIAHLSVASINFVLEFVEDLTLVSQSVEQAFFSYDDFKSKKNTQSIKKIAFCLKTTRKAIQDMDKGLSRAYAIALTRTLAEMPSNVCTPLYLTKQAEKLAKKHKNIEASIFDKKQCKTLKMNSFLSVSSGSNEGAYLIKLSYLPKSNKPPIVLVGKGITFDTGGHSLKPANSMMGMKFDMCGAATVLGLFEYLGHTQPDQPVIGLVPTCENIPGGSANKPDDVVKSMSGQTIEILNTDAEGRLILCDALTYAERFKPKYVIDIATLTGACLATFGTVASGLMGNCQTLIDELLKSGQQSLDRAWPLPLWEEFDKMIDSPVADIANIGGSHAGTITAGCFLARFTKSYKWAHLDIAGTACEFKGHKRGSTGRPVALLAQFIDNQS